jgi:hypothetical protein
MHRVAWDLRYPDPEALNFGYSGNMLEYREYTLSWHALPGLTPRSTLVGPMVLPGSYTATLNVNGRSYTQPITVVQDPRVNVPPAALAAQFQLAQRMVAGIAATHGAYNYVQQLRAALRARTSDADGNGAGSASAAQALEAELAPLIDGPSGFGIAHRDLGRRLNDQLVADAEPTPSIVAGVDGPCRLIDAALDKLRALQSTKVAELNAARSKSGAAALPSWTGPAAPACGSSAVDNWSLVGREIFTAPAERQHNRQ